ncbi:MAG: ABC transporter permease [Armatimonadetes bacterium]|nr:ABC transporter permease [Armatimonadota bacterium]
MGGRALLQRLLHALLVALGASTVVFFIARLGGDPAILMAEPTARPEEIEALRRSMGLHDPLYIQYARFLGRAGQGDLGRSLWQQQPAVGLVLERTPATLELTAAALLLSAAIALPVGVVSAVWRGGRVDRLSMTAALFFQCIPGFWFGMILIFFFAVRLHWLPTSGGGSLAHLILPAVTLAAYSTGRLARLTRSGMLEVLKEDYIRTARGKGVAEPTVVVRHGLRNALVPILTLVGLEFGALMGGAVIVETVFGWPGLGRLTIQAIQNRDFPLVQASVLFVAAVVVVVNLAVDILYTTLDPRIRYD